MIYYWENKTDHNGSASRDSVVVKQLKSSRNKIFEFYKANVWKVWGTGLTAAITISGIFSIILSTFYASSCSTYYQVDKRYFEGQNVFGYKSILIACMLILFIYPFIISYLNKGFGSKSFKAFAFLLIFTVLGLQSVIYVDIIREYSPCKLLESLFAYWVVVVLSLVADLILTYYFIRDKGFPKEGDANNKKALRLARVSLGVFYSVVIIGMMIAVFSGVRQKKWYEIINDNKAIISAFDGKYVVLDCEIISYNKDEDILKLRKGKYSLIGMTELPIVYHKFSEVSCE